MPKWDFNKVAKSITRDQSVWFVLFLKLKIVTTFFCMFVITVKPPYKGHPL